jgi:hypothetical protein
MSKWLIIEVEDSAFRKTPLIGDGSKLIFVVTPGLSIIPETRSVDDVLASAQEKGWEIRYACSTMPGVPPWTWDKIEIKVLAHLRESLRVNVKTHDVSISPLNVLLQT